MTLTRSIHRLRTEVNLLTTRATGEQRARLRLAADALADAMDVETICPACGFNHGVEPEICPSCGLSRISPHLPDEETHRREYRYPPARPGDDGPLGGERV